MSTRQLRITLLLAFVVVALIIAYFHCVDKPEHTDAVTKWATIGASGAGVVASIMNIV